MQNSKLIIKKAIKQGTWFGFLKFLSQIISWVITIAIARILSPADYGLMAMATILTGYVMIFSELGFGAAIIQKESITDDELSSVFWFIISFGALLSVIAFILSYPTAIIFDDKRLIPITQVASVLFIINAILIVPNRLLDRNVEFIKSGVIEFMSVFISGISMFIMAKKGYGVWTLILGHIIRSSTMVFLCFILTRWRPLLHYKYSEVVPFLKFGLFVAGSRSFMYIYQKSDRYFAGRAFGVTLTGYYSFALQLASIPTDKIVSLIQRVSFPVFSKLKDSHEQLAESYLRIVKSIAFIVFPIYFGGILFADEIVSVVLGEKWAPIIYPFKMLCFAQVVVSLFAINGLVHEAQNRPKRTLYFNMAVAVSLCVGFYFSSKYGFKAFVLPWITIYPAINIVWLVITLKILNIPLFRYIVNLVIPSAVTIIMVGSLEALRYVLINFGNPFSPSMTLALNITTGALLYLLIFLSIHKKKGSLFMGNE